jgi:hypothetical protein
LTGDRRQQKAGASGDLCAAKAFSVILRPNRVVRTNKDWIMSLFRICTGAAIVAGVLLLATLEGAGNFIAPGAYAGEYTQKKKSRTYRKSREATVEQGSTPEEIARYFALHGGNIDPYINKQSPGGPFDSGFFFDSGIGPNGGDSPYMN